MRRCRLENRNSTGSCSCHCATYELDIKSMDMNTGLVPRELLEDAARRFQLLGEPVRLEILNLLQVREEMNVQEIVEATGQSHANISKHLRLMATAGLVARRKEGLYAFYHIVDPSLSGLCLLVCSQLRRGVPADALTDESA